jgi:hypothetical protein
MTNWQNFPPDFPPDNEQILVMGITNPDLPNYRGGEIIYVVAKWARFEHNAYARQCRLNNDLEEKWITAGFQTLDFYPVRWLLWSRIEKPSVEQFDAQIAALAE